MIARHESAGIFLWKEKNMFEKKQVSKQEKEERMKVYAELLKGKGEKKYGSKQ